MTEEQCQQQQHQGLIEDFIELSEGLSESSDMCDVVFPRENQEEIFPFIIEEGSGKAAADEPKKDVLKPFPIELNPTANAQATYNPLPVALYPELLHILPIPATQFTPKRTGTTKATQFAMPALQKFKTLVATVRAFATTSKTLAATHVAWHSGWFGCRFGFGAPEPRHF